MQLLYCDSTTSKQLVCGQFAYRVVQFVFLLVNESASELVDHLDNPLACPSVGQSISLFVSQPANQSVSWLFIIGRLAGEVRWSCRNAVRPDAA